MFNVKLTLLFCPKPLVANGNPDDKNYRKDMFTPEQRIQLFDALVAKTKNPIDLVSDETLKNVLTWGRAEMIPKLADIGVKIEGQHFVRAANPYHRPNEAIKIMEAVLPYDGNNVNVADSRGVNAGHAVAENADLDAFKWLEERGLKKEAVAKEIWPSTYAHMVAIGRDNLEEKRIKFASYLADNKYPIDAPGRDNTTPTESAIDKGRVSLALVYINAGAAAKPEYLPRSIAATHFNTAKAKDVRAIGKKLAEKGEMSKDTVTRAFKELFHIIAKNRKNIQQGVPIAVHLLFQKNHTTRGCKKEEQRPT
ncbi:MAG: ankyrin repeat domain-containing protein [Pseudomonadota bacterium]